MAIDKPTSLNVPRSLAASPIAATCNKLRPRASVSTAKALALLTPAGTFLDQFVFEKVALLKAWIDSRHPQKHIRRLVLATDQHDLAGLFPISQ